MKMIKDAVRTVKSLDDIEKNKVAMAVETAHGDSFDNVILDESFCLAVINEQNLNESAGSTLAVYLGTGLTMAVSIFAAKLYIVSKIFAAVTAPAATPVQASAALSVLGVSSPAAVIGAGAIGAAALLYGGYKVASKIRESNSLDVVASELTKVVRSRDSAIRNPIGDEKRTTKKIEELTKKQISVARKMETALNKEVNNGNVDQKEEDQLRSLLFKAKQGKLSYL